MRIADHMIKLGMKLKSRSAASLPIYAVSPGYQITGLATSANTPALLEAYRGWTAACVDHIADTCISANRRYKNGLTDEDLPPEHPLVTLFKKPCPAMKRITFEKLAWIWLELDGDCFWYKAKDRLGVTRELWPISPDRMYVVPDEYELVKGYLYRYMGKTIAFERDEIVHIMYPNPLNIHRGMGTLERAAYEYDIDLYIKKYQMSVFKNRARPDGTLETDQELDEDDIEKLRDQWFKAYGSVDRAGKVAILSNGLKFNRVQLGPVEIDYLNSSKDAREALMGVFGVPLGKRGMVKDVNRANGEELERTFQKDIIKPKLLLMAEHIETDIAADFDSRITVEYDENVPQDVEFDLKEEEADLKTGVRTINEIRARRGYDPVEWGELPWMPYSLIQVGSENQNDQQNNSARVISEPYPRIRSSNEEDVRTAIWRAFISIHDPHCRAVRNTMQSYFADQRNFVLKQFDEQSQRAADIIRVDLNIEYIMFNIDEAMALLQEKIEPHYRDMLLKGLRKGLDEIGSEADAFINARLKSWLEIEKERFSTQITETTVDSIRSEMGIGLEAGEGWNELRARVNKVFDYADEVRAENIAVTESTGAINRGNLNALEMIEGFLKDWLTARDGNERDWHGVMDGQTREPSESFESGKGVALMFPGDPACGDPSEICRCRCAMTARKK